MEESISSISPSSGIGHGKIEVISRHVGSNLELISVPSLKSDKDCVIVILFLADFFLKIHAIYR